MNLFEFEFGGKEHFHSDDLRSVQLFLDGPAQCVGEAAQKVTEPVRAAFAELLAKYQQATSAQNECTTIGGVTIKINGRKWKT